MAAKGQFNSPNVKAVTARAAQLCDCLCGSQSGAGSGSGAGKVQAQAATRSKPPSKK